MVLAVLVWAASAEAVPFNITITNTGTNTAYPWSVGLLTLSPTIAIGLSPQPGSPSYPTYSYANSHCGLSDSFCSGGGCNDNGNAIVLAQRLGLTLGVNAWLVPALAAGGNATATVAIDAPVGSRLSFIAWINNTSVFDDFVAFHPAGDVNTLSVPLFDAMGQPLPTVAFAVGGYDTNSTSPTNGSGATCSLECPTQTTGCYVAPGNASIGFPGTYPPQPSTTQALTLVTSGLATTTTPQVTYTLTYRNQSGSRVNNSVLTYRLPAGVTFVSASNGVTPSGSTVTWNINRLNAGATGFQTVTVNLGGLGSTTAHSGSIAWTAGGRNYNLTSNVVTTLYSVTMVPTWTSTISTGHFTDGLAVADLDGSPGSELVVVAPARGTLSGPGRSIVLRSDTGNEVSTFATSAGRNVMGLPLTEELVGGGTREYVFGEAHPAALSAAVFARLGTSGSLWTSLPYGYASYWNMGPSSADVSPSAGTELVVADWDGHVSLLTGSSGAAPVTYNTWDADGDHAFGHVALADIDVDGTLEAVIFGNTLGTVIALNAETMTLQWKSASLKTLYGDAAYGSGPAIGDIDGDNSAEIVVATRGTTSDIYAFNQLGVCEHRFDPGGSFTYTSPVIGHVDGSGLKSVVALSSSTSVLSVMRAATPGCAAAGGLIVWQHTIKAGEGSAFTPILYDVTGDGVLDVIAASKTRLEVIDVKNRNVVLAFEDPTATFTPSGVIANADGAGARELYVTGWRNSKVYRLPLPATATSPNDWTTFMGGNTRTGAR